MPISFHCAACNAKITAPESATGRKSNCPKCEAQVVVPGESKQAATPVLTSVPVEVVRPLPVANREKECMACGELVLEKAVVCKHCGYDPDRPPERAATGGVHVIVQNTVAASASAQASFTQQGALVERIVFTLSLIVFFVSAFPCVGMAVAIPACAMLVASCVVLFLAIRNEDATGIGYALAAIVVCLLALALVGMWVYMANNIVRPQ